ncbi:stage III sporulation protein AA [Aneurinibacillus terranovensis]|uniref:stage III sporulation protein AA n=1 Tax=Aneurinibacillus terranovensis TaxID=278991 RepID=UPI000487642E|nr:stage III sporulation protein AA [Aneurinibacillus terranovensis]
MGDVTRVLPDRIRRWVGDFPSDVQNKVEEIRLRINRPVECIVGGRSFFITGEGSLVPSDEQTAAFTREEAVQLMNRLSLHSLYTMEEEMRRGYITISGGHRVGIAGKVVLEGGSVKLIRDITSFNIRIAREQPGVAERVLPLLVNEQVIRSTLIISPPQCGKTTLLRDLARLLSTGTSRLPGRKVSIVDERSEIAGCVGGIPQKNVGPRTDVLDGCPKAEGMMMMIRSMSPDVLITDEIGRAEDGYALEEAIHAGISVITTAHGKDLKDIMRRPTLSRIAQSGVFERYLILGRRPSIGSIQAVYDENFTERRKERMLC